MLPFIMRDEELVMSEMDMCYKNTNEFKYQRYLVTEAQNEISALKSRETEYKKLLDESRALLEKLGGQV